MRMRLTLAHADGLLTLLPPPLRRSLGRKTWRRDRNSQCQSFGLNDDVVTATLMGPEIATSAGEGHLIVSADFKGTLKVFLAAPSTARA